jgi:hypothetical protein
MLIDVMRVLFLAGGVASFMMASYNFVVMLAGVKQEAKRFINYLGPLAFIFPQLYDELGNRARVKALISIVLMIISIAGFAFMSN